MTTYEFQSDVKGKVDTGDHKVEVFKKFVTEWKPEDKAAQRFKDEVVRELENATNRIPAHDTGYQKVSAGNDYEIIHNLGIIPKKVECYLSDVSDPVSGKNTVRHIALIKSYSSGAAKAWSGAEIIHDPAGNKSTLSCGPDSLYNHSANWTEGYARVLLWR